MRTTQYLQLEKRIALGERGGVLDRWRYGRALLDAKAGRKKLPDGLLADLVKAAQRAGIKGVSEQEIQRRIRCAEAYQSEAHCVRAGRDFGSWSALREAGFPPVEHDGLDPDDLEAEIEGEAVMTEQPTGHRPRRAPQPPRIDEADRPPDAEVERQRQASRQRWQPFVRFSMSTHPNNTRGTTR